MNMLIHVFLFVLVVEFLQIILTNKLYGTTETLEENVYITKFINKGNGVLIDGQFVVTVGEWSVCNACTFI